MSHMLIAWEHGMGLGHLQSLRPLTALLQERGHRVTFVLRDLSRAHKILGADATVLQAPVWKAPRVPSGRPAAGYAEFLARLGYLDADAMTGFARGWRQLYTLLAPDLLVCEHATTALLASRGTGLRTVMVGTGFTCPPPVTHLRFDAMLDTSKAQAKLEEQVLGALNRVLNELAAPPLAHLGELQAVDAQLIHTLEPLDPFRNRREQVAYRGPRGTGACGEPPRWPKGQGPQLFAYLKPSNPGFETMMQALARVPGRVLAVVPGAESALMRRYNSQRIHVTQHPVQMAQTLADASMVVCHGGHGTTCAALLAGVPVLAMPSQLEQFLTARRVQQMGLGATLLPVPDADPLSVLERLLDEPTIAEGARAFAARHQKFDEYANTRSDVVQLEKLLASA